MARRVPQGREGVRRESGLLNRQPFLLFGQYEPDMRSGKTKYASIYRYKGLEARAVVLTDIERLETEHDRDLFYIGATRATHRLVVLAREGLRRVLLPPSG